MFERDDVAVPKPAVASLREKERIAFNVDVPNSLQLYVDQMTINL